MTHTTLNLFHGSSEIIRLPEYGRGRLHNDYGRGFYCTENEELSKEWACTSLSNGISNHYVLDTNNLALLDLGNEDFTILNWLAVLVHNRIFRPGTPVAGRAKRYLADHFMVNVDAYDIVKGYRADDAYYDFADAFLNNALTIEQLSAAMRLGKLGEQIVLKSRRAFDRIEFVGYSLADATIYYPARKNRCEQADDAFRKMCDASDDGLYMIDILREKVKNDDMRIPRNIPQQSND